eukprot:5620886-Pleurochrysis_carterae.AAC.3
MERRASSGGHLKGFYGTITAAVSLRAGGSERDGFGPSASPSVWASLECQGEKAGGEGVGGEAERGGECDAHCVGGGVGVGAGGSVVASSAHTTRGNVSDMQMRYIRDAHEMHSS